MYFHNKILCYCFHSLNYVQCSSGTVATYDCSGNNEVGLVFDGINRELRTCNFNLASGKCFGQDDICTVSYEPPTTTSTGQSYTITSTSVNSVLTSSNSGKKN